MARATLKDVAELAGVTAATVSYSLSGKRTISEETKARVMSDIIGQKLAAAAAGTMTAQEALDQAQSECTAQIQLG